MAKRLITEKGDGVIIIRFVDKVIMNPDCDFNQTEEIGNELYSLVANNVRVLLNCTEVEYMCSAMLGKLITLNEKIGRVHGELVICNLAPQIFEVFEITGLARVFKISHRVYGIH